jgi:hypothetical protein
MVYNISVCSVGTNRLVLLKTINAVLWQLWETHKCTFCGNTLFSVKVLRTLALISTGTDSVKGTGCAVSVVSVAVITSVNVTGVVT